MSFVVFVDSKKNNLIEQIHIKKDVVIDLNSKNYDFSPLEEFVEDNFSILYSDGKIENAKLLSVGKTDDGVPMLTYDLLDDRKGDLEDE